MLKEEKCGVSYSSKIKNCPTLHTVSDENLMKQLPLSLTQGVSEGAMAALVPQDDACRAL